MRTVLKILVFTYRYECNIKMIEDKGENECSKRKNNNLGGKLLILIFTVEKKNYFEEVEGVRPCSLPSWTGSKIPRMPGSAAKEGENRERKRAGASERERRKEERERHWEKEKDKTEDRKRSG